MKQIVLLTSIVLTLTSCSPKQSVVTDSPPPESCYTLASGVEVWGECPPKRDVELQTTWVAHETRHIFQFEGLYLFFKKGRVNCGPLKALGCFDYPNSTVFVQTDDLLIPWDHIYRHELGHVVLFLRSDGEAAMGRSAMHIPAEFFDHLEQGP